MSSEQTVFVLIASLVGNGYLFLLLMRRWNELRFYTYMMNLFAIGLCGTSLILSAENLVWIAAFLWNLVLQNILITRMTPSTAALASSEVKRA